MTVAILGIIAALVPLIVLLVKRRVAVNDDKQTQYEKSVEKTDKIIAKGDADGLNDFLDGSLNKLPDDKNHSG